MPDEFDWETGLFSGVGTIAEEWFAVGDGGGNTNLYLKVIGPDDEGEPRYGTGADWASFDGGESVEHPQSGEKLRRYHQNTAIAQLFRAAFECGAEDILRKRSRELYANQGPRHAKLWHGLTFRWEIKTEHLSMKDKQTGAPIERDIQRTLPVEFLGEGNVVAPAQPQAPQQAAPPTNSPTPAAAAPAAPEANGDPLSTLSVEDTAKAKVLAKSLPYHEWVDKMLELPNAVASDSLMAALGDEALYTQLKEG